PGVRGALRQVASRNLKEKSSSERIFPETLRGLRGPPGFAGGRGTNLPILRASAVPTPATAEGARNSRSRPRERGPPGLYLFKILNPALSPLPRGQGGELGGVGGRLPAWGDRESPGPRGGANASA